MSKKSIFKRNAIHALVWTIWFGINCLVLIKSPVKIDVWPIIYNFLSLMFVYYGVYYAASLYFQKMNYEDFQWRKSTGKLYYILMRAEVSYVTLIVLGYIFMSWLVDQNIFNKGYTDLLTYSLGRFVREAIYVLFAVCFAYFDEYVKRQERKNKVKDERIINLQEYIDRKNGEQDAALQQIFNALDQLKNEKGTSSS